MRKLTALILALALSLVTVGAMAAGGSATDPLISLSYLTGTYKTQLDTQIKDRVETGTSQTYQDALNKLNEVGSAYLSGGQSGTWSTSSGYAARTGSRGDALTLSAGSGVLVSAGSASASAPLVDVTAGTVLPAGSTLTAGHRYLNGEESSVVVTVKSDSISWAWEGTWSLSQSGADATVFTDLISTQWYYTGVRWAVDRGLMAGISGTVFSCNTSMTRAMMATVLYRYEGEPDTDYVLAFLDVPSGQWYSLPISWAADKGIVNGIGGGKFGLNNQITREQIATMLYRYAGEYRGLDVSARGDLTAFPDADDVSAYAREALSWAVGAGIIGGSDGWLLPQDNATRAQVALMLQRFDALVS